MVVLVFNEETIELYVETFKTVLLWPEILCSNLKIYVALQKMAKKKKQRFVPRDDDDQTLHRVIMITGETKKEFRVMWAGDDPNTGQPWAQSLMLKEDCTDDLINAWNMEKEAEAQKSAFINDPLNQLRLMALCLAQLKHATNSLSAPSNHISLLTVSDSTPTALGSRKRNFREMGNANADPPSGGTTAQGTLMIANTVRKITKLKALPHGVDTLTSGLGSSANDVSGLGEGDLSGVKIGPPSRKKQKKLDHNPTDDVEMQIDTSKMKIGPPSRKKQKKQGCTSADRTDEIASSTNNSHVTVSPAVTFTGKPYWTYGQIASTLSPGSIKRLADFDRDVLVLDSDSLSACEVNGSQAEKDIGLALGTNGEKGEAIKIQDIRECHSRITTV